MHSITALVPSASVLLLAATAFPASSASDVSGYISPSPPPDPLPRIIAFADNLIEHARDRYGPVKTPLFVCHLDIDTKKFLPPDSGFFASKGRGGAGPHMNNLQFDSSLVRLLYALTETTGNRKYAAAAADYLEYYLEHLPDKETGFFPWGDHCGYDLVRDEPFHDNKNVRHEFKVTYPPWDRIYAINPFAATRQIESLRRHVIDESRSWAFSRHFPPGQSPHSMNSSGGAYMAAWAFLFDATGDDRYAEWTHRMGDYFWSLHHPETKLLAAHPFDPAYANYFENSEHARARAARTEYMGQATAYACNLLRASEMIGEHAGEKFRARALESLRAFLGRTDPEPDGSFYATFDLATGKPMLPRITEGWQHYQQQTPPGWSGGVVGIRLLSSIGFACKMTGEPDLKEMFARFRPLVDWPKFERVEGEPEPVSAGLLAGVIGGFLNMHQAFGEQRHLDDAWILGRYALRHFHRDGWFVAGPPTVVRYRDPNVDVWRTYSNRGGSDDLALILLRLHLVTTGKPDPLEDDPFSTF